MTRRRILIGGYFGAGNAGDEAILEVMVREILARDPDTLICVSSRSPDATRNRLGVDAVAAGEPAAIWAAAAESDLIVLGGGGLFQDYWGAFSDTVLGRGSMGLGHYTTFPLAAALLRKKCMIFSVGAGPFTTAEGAAAARLACGAADVVTVRDDESRAALVGAGVPETSIDVCGDPAVLLSPDAEGARALVEAFERGTRKVRIAVALRGWNLGVDPDAWRLALADGLSRIAERIDARFLFLPFQNRPGSIYEDDLAAMDFVRTRLPDRSRAIQLPGDLPPRTIAGVIARCDLAVGMRFHSVLFAAASGTPFLAINYDDKVASFVRRINLPEALLDLGSLSGERVAEKILVLLEDGERIRRHLGEKRSDLESSASRGFERLSSLLSAPPVSREETSEFVPWFATEIPSRLFSARQSLEAANRDRSELQARLAETGRKLDEYRELSASRGFVWLQRLWALRRTLVPRGSVRERALRAVAKIVRSLWRIAVAAPAAAAERAAARVVDGWRRREERVRAPYRPAYRIVDRTEVTLFATSDSIFPAYSPRRSLLDAGRKRAPVSLVATFRNESGNIPRWIESLLAQRRVPDDCVFVDGGSTDGSTGLLAKFAEAAPFPVSILSGETLNIAAGRNRGIDRARHPVIAVTDFGCRLDPDWLDRLVAPFEIDGGIDVSAGWSRPEGEGPSALGRRDGADLVPGAYLPSSRSIAFRKAAWRGAGGYPEWLTQTGEDTLFDLELKRLGGRWAFVPEAVVFWQEPRSIVSDWRKAYRWARGDGESGIFADDYEKEFDACRRLAGRYAVGLGAAAAAALAAGRLAGLPGGVIAALLAAVSLRKYVRRARTGPAIRDEVRAFMRVAGFVAGFKNRNEVARRRARSISGTIVILSGVPIDDTGGGSRFSQLALEFLRQGFAVLFINKFPKYESVDLRLSFEQPLLRRAALEDFDLAEFERFDGWMFEASPFAVLVEMPHPDFLPLVDEFRRRGATVVYDNVDEWDSSLGGAWYSRGAEDSIISGSHLLLAVSPDLKTRLADRAGRPVELVPNAVNAELFDPDRARIRPEDLPPSEWIAIYVGALWAEWFDWETLRQVATENPDGTVIVIGDYRGQCVDPPSNLHFLGLRPQESLPDYIAACDVAMLIRRPSTLTESMSPLKVFEYLAMRKPVVAPRLPALEGVPGVTLADDSRDFARKVRLARQQTLDPATIAAYVGENNWRSRVRRIRELIRPPQATPDRPRST